MEAQTLMKGFPPPPEQRVTLGNWRKPPFNKWSFGHVREIVPSAEISNNPQIVRKLPSASHDFATLKIPTEKKSHDIVSFLRATDTDGFVVLHRGKVAYEFYDNGVTRDTPHILMSVSKSILGLIVGCLVEQDVIKLGTIVT